MPSQKDFHKGRTELSLKITLSVSREIAFLDYFEYNGMEIAQFRL